MTAPLGHSDHPPSFGQPSGSHDTPPGFGWGGAIAGAAVVVVVLGSLLWSALAGSTVSAQRPRVFGGSLVLEDQKAPTVIDVATGQATVRLDGVYDQVGATNPA